MQPPVLCVVYCVYARAQGPPRVVSTGVLQCKTAASEGSPVCYIQQLAAREKHRHAAPARFLGWQRPTGVLCAASVEFGRFFFQSFTWFNRVCMYVAGSLLRGCD